MEKFDAQVLGVLDGEVFFPERKKKPFRYSYCPKTGTDAPQDLPSELIDGISRVRLSTKRLKRLEDYDAPRVFIQSERSSGRNREKEVERIRVAFNIQKTTIETLRHGKLGLHFLIDSPGGNGHLGEPATELLEDVSRREGSNVTTYALNEACSLAANLWSIGNQRYVLNDSTILLHTGSHSSLEDKNEEKEGILRFLNQAQEEFLAPALEIIEKDIDGRHTIIFDGRVAASAGLAAEAFRNPEALQAQFNRNTGEAWVEDRKTKRFWAKCKRAWGVLAFDRMIARLIGQGK